MRRTHKQIGYVYFVVEVGGEAIKIGYTSGTPTHRVTSLAVERGKTLEIVGLIIGNKKTEAELHQRFEKERLEGEWFRSHEALVKFIAELSYVDAKEFEQCVGLRFDKTGQMKRQAVKGNVG